ncbi:hypothetical protein, partial [Wandonia haliotis]|uniref:hypothetical protein n=1 Tax=Wandonia haliotis TaxID=574963 RepID=UPI0031DF0E84
MKHFFRQFLTAVTLSLIAGWGLAQNPLWTLPGSYYDHSIPALNSLPTPTDPNNTYDPGEQYYYYQGQEAASTHNSMMDAQGN